MLETKLLIMKKEDDLEDDDETADLGEVQK